MGKLPFMQFFPDAWLVDTRRLSPLAKAAWIDILCYCWNAPERGVYSRTLPAMAFEHGVTQEVLAKLLEELAQVAEINRSGGAVTIMSRRIVREEKVREYERTRKRWQRENTNVPDLSRNCPAVVTQEKLEVRSQKLEEETLQGDAAVQQPPRPVIPYLELQEAWNGNSGPLPRVTALTDKRRAKLRLRWLEVPNMEYWRLVIRRVAASKFCQGKSDRGWIADFDWLIANDTNHVKVMEGKYDNKPAYGVPQYAPPAPREPDPRPEDLPTASEVREMVSKLAFMKSMPKENGHV